ncbi:MAG: helix-turn-helix domain-containing protein [Roseateles asaccharophilus]|uniref:Transcriptional regulator with XRE-family HTH domain n=1 Tax=Roseateles asaccharophilus TaxID=582607 RepID=A0A4R6N7I8_9BURK|nr:helix-turn-helix transcriptional regulator [Roseateles asaccharophilus]MDN3546094.1 helix-turn-helix transcriptional regulator [Roseateles asaccharophilus]TDP11175.1 transcriptional regulator with XRE-family HTH domain [Roseateles asaccharophilus]
MLAVASVYATTSEVIAVITGPSYASGMHPLTALRRQRRVSQMELGLRAGVSQRHLSCIETGRSRPSRGTLLALLDALDASLTERNAALLAAGLAPAYSQHALDAPQLGPARDALQQLLHAPGSPPALVLDAEWNLVMANAGVQRLLDLLGLPMPEQPANLLDWLLGSGGMRSCVINEAEVCGEILHRARREATQVPALAARLAQLQAVLPSWPAPEVQTPLLLTRLRSRIGELRLFSMFSSFGAPLDVTLASLRIEHLFAADAATADALAGAA